MRLFRNPKSEHIQDPTEHLLNSQFKVMGSLNRLLVFLIPATLILLGILTGSVAENNGATGNKKIVADAYELDPTKEFIEFCERQRDLRQDPDSAKGHSISLSSN